MPATEEFHTLKCLHEVLDSLRFEISFVNWEEVRSSTQEKRDFKFHQWW